MIILIKMTNIHVHIAYKTDAYFFCEAVVPA